MLNLKCSDDVNNVTERGRVNIGWIYAQERRLGALKISNIEYQILHACGMISDVDFRYQYINVVSLGLS
jgi:hypothetical protein